MKNDTLKSVSVDFDGRDLVFNGFKSAIFPIRPTEGIGLPGILNRVVRVFDREDCSHLKVLIPKQMLQRLTMAHTQVRAGNTSEKLINEISQNIYSVHQTKEIIEKVCNNIMNAINYETKWTLYL